MFFDNSTEQGQSLLLNLGIGFVYFGVLGLSMYYSDQSPIAVWVSMILLLGILVYASHCFFDAITDLLDLWLKSLFESDGS